MKDLYSIFLKLMVIDLVLKGVFLITQSINNSIDQPLGSTLGYFLFIELFFFAVPYFFVLWVYLFLIERYRGSRWIIVSWVRALLTVCYTTIIASLVYYIWFYGEWPTFQTVTFFGNSILIGIALFWLTRLHLIKPSQGDE
ncbi:hypothetical protein BFP97_19530 [Roseivirga sp. 4D4]|uniref:hypothetical protein n=1 Tax=Roseivirga sp. 4D4 TaxID=1889784 RepID=UPI000852A953|nr:hypothetical protein [Roseivirga sp. 4D4]OEK03572.1 hypothetical protein BFP97_19530 [Roseivirga sp. 4D4]